MAVKGELYHKIKVGVPREIEKRFITTEDFLRCGGKKKGIWKKPIRTNGQINWDNRVIRAINRRDGVWNIDLNNLKNIGKK